MKQRDRTFNRGHGAVLPGENDKVRDNLLLKADVNFLYGLLEKARMERDEHLTVIARMRANIASKDEVISNAVIARNKEKRLFERALDRAGSGYRADNESLRRECADLRGSLGDAVKALNRAKTAMEGDDVYQNLLRKWLHITMNIALSTTSTGKERLAAMIDETCATLPSMAAVRDTMLDASGHTVGEMWKDVFVGKPSVKKVVSTTSIATSPEKTGTSTETGMSTSSSSSHPVPPKNQAPSKLASSSHRATTIKRGATTSTSSKSLGSSSGKSPGLLKRLSKRFSLNKGKGKNKGKSKSNHSNDEGGDDNVEHEDGSEGEDEVLINKETEDAGEDKHVEGGEEVHDVVRATEPPQIVMTTASEPASTLTSTSTTTPISPLQPRNTIPAPRPQMNGKPETETRSIQGTEKELETTKATINDTKAGVRLIRRISVGLGLVKSDDQLKKEEERQKTAELKKNEEIEKERQRLEEKAKKSVEQERQRAAEDEKKEKEKLRLRQEEERKRAEEEEKKRAEEEARKRAEEEEKKRAEEEEEEARKRAQDEERKRAEEEEKEKVRLQKEEEEKKRIEDERRRQEEVNKANETLEHQEERKKATDENEKEKTRLREQEEAQQKDKKNSTEAVDPMEAYVNRTTAASTTPKSRPSDSQSATEKSDPLKPYTNRDIQKTPTESKDHVESSSLKLNSDTTEAAPTQAAILAPTEAVHTPVDMPTPVPTPLATLKVNEELPPGVSPSKFEVGGRIVSRHKSGSLIWSTIVKKSLSSDKKTWKYKVKFDEGPEIGAESWLKESGLMESKESLTSNLSVSVPTTPMTAGGGPVTSTIRLDKPNVSSAPSMGQSLDGSKYENGGRIAFRSKQGVLVWGLIVKKALSSDGKTWKYKVTPQEGPDMGTEMWIKEQGVFADKEAISSTVAPPITPRPNNTANVPGEGGLYAVSQRLVAKYKGNLVWVQVNNKTLSSDQKTWKYNVTVQDGADVGTVLWLKEQGLFLSMSTASAHSSSAPGSTPATPSVSTAIQSAPPERKMSVKGGPRRASVQRKMSRRVSARTPVIPAKYQIGDKLFVKITGRGMKKGVVLEMRPTALGNAWQYNLQVSGDTEGTWINETDVKTKMK